MPVSMHLDESKSAAPGISPGVVIDEEFVLRELFNPEHVVDGRILERAIPVKDLRQRGFSVHRMAYVEETSIEASIAARLTRTRNGAPWETEGVSKLKVKHVRQIRPDGKQAFVVIDTARPDDPSHASIYVAEPKLGEPYARKLRSMLLLLLQNRMPLSQAYSRHQ